MKQFKRFREYQQALRIVCDRPALLLPLWEKGLTLEESLPELMKFKRQGMRLFKDPHRAGKIGRLLSLGQVQAAGRRGVIKALRELSARRMEPEARAWLKTAIESMEKQS